MDGNLFPRVPVLALCAIVVLLGATGCQKRGDNSEAMEQDQGRPDQVAPEDEVRVPGDWATPKDPFTNSLGMKFVALQGTDVLFSIWETRVKDYAAYAKANSGMDREWRDPEFKGVPVAPARTARWST